MTNANTIIVEVFCPICKARDSLPAAAIEILRATRDAGNGVLSVNPSPRGYVMQTGEVQILDRTDRRKEAVFLEALDLLMNGDYMRLERPGDSVLRVLTNRGYEVLDRLDS
jgi:hypothetical protein